jgi:hypothetical protein
MALLKEGVPTQFPEVTTGYHIVLSMEFSRVHQYARVTVGSYVSETSRQADISGNLSSSEYFIRGEEFQEVYRRMTRDYAAVRVQLEQLISSADADGNVATTASELEDVLAKVDRASLFQQVYNYIRGVEAARDPNATPRPVFWVEEESFNTHVPDTTTMQSLPAGVLRDLDRVLVADENTVYRLTTDRTTPDTSVGELAWTPDGGAAQGVFTIYREDGPLSKFYDATSDHTDIQ